MGQGPVGGLSSFLEDRGFDCEVVQTMILPDLHCVSLLLQSSLLSHLIVFYGVPPVGSLLKYQVAHLRVVFVDSLLEVESTGSAQGCPAYWEVCSDPTLVARSLARDR